MNKVAGYAPLLAERLADLMGGHAEHPALISRFQRGFASLAHAAAWMVITVRTRCAQNLCQTGEADCRGINDRCLHCGWVDVTIDDGQHVAWMSGRVVLVGKSALRMPLLIPRGAHSRIGQTSARSTPCLRA